MIWVDVNFRLPTKEECDKNDGMFLVYLGNWKETRHGMKIVPVKYCQWYEEKNEYEHGWMFGAYQWISHWAEMPLSPFEVQEYEYR